MTLRFRLPDPADLPDDGRELETFAGESLVEAPLNSCHAEAPEEWMPWFGSHEMRPPCVGPD